MKTLSSLMIGLALSGCAADSHPGPYPNPDEAFIEIRGAIDARVKYRIMVEYVPRLEAGACRRYNWLAGLTVPRTVRFDYLPGIEAGRHHIRVPLMAAPPDTGCVWTPRTVYICLSDRQHASPPAACQSLLFIQEAAPPLPGPIELECDHRFYCSGPSGLLTETVAASNRSLTVNIRLSRPAGHGRDD